MTGRVLLLGFALLIALSLLGRDDVLPAGADVVSFSGAAAYWHDEAGEATPATIVGGRFDDRFEPWHKRSLVRVRQGQQWLRLEVHNPRPHRRAMLVV